MSDRHRPPPDDSDDFTIVLGGPLYQIYLETHLALPGLVLLRRRLFTLTAIAWAPIVVLAVLGGRALGGVAVPLYADVEVHARFLLAVPLLILAEVVCHRRLRKVVRQFVDRGLVAPDDLGQLEQATESARRLRNSVPVEVVLLVWSVAIHWIWGQAMLLHEASWLGTIENGELRYTAAGAWYAFVSLPIFRFLLFRWYYRVFIWYRFLWQVSRMDLRLNALHPDRAAGLGFLSTSPPVFTPLLLAHSVLLAGMIMNKIWHSGATLPDFRFEIVAVLVFAMLLALTPLFFFSSKLVAAKRAASAQYGAMASRYVAGFHEKWLAGGIDPGESLVGSADIQSLADLSGAYEAVRDTRFVPLTRQAVIQLLVMTAIPLFPLVLTKVPFEEILKRVAGFLF